MNAEMEKTKAKDIDINLIGRILRDQRAKTGTSQATVAKELKYVNMNFISMIESGRSKIPMNRVDDFVEAYGLNPEFTLVILWVMYPEVLTSILKLANRIPKIFKGFIKTQDEEIEDIFNTAKNSIYSRS